MFLTIFLDFSSFETQIIVVIFILINFIQRKSVPIIGNSVKYKQSDSEQYSSCLSRQMEILTLDRPRKSTFRYALQRRGGLSLRHDGTGP